MTTHQPRIHHRKTIYWYRNQLEKPHAFFALDEDRKVYLCMVVASYTPIEGDGIPDIFLCREIDRNIVRRIYTMTLNELSSFMRMTFTLYAFETDIWTPKNVVLQPLIYNNIPDSWWASSMEALVQRKEMRLIRNDLRTNLFTLTPHQEFCTGFTAPYDGATDWELSHGIFCFNVKMSQIKPDKEEVADLLKRYIKSQIDCTGKKPSKKDTKELAELAREEVIKKTSPCFKTIQVMVDFNKEEVFIASSSPSVLDNVSAYLLSTLGFTLLPTLPTGDADVLKRFANLHISTSSPLIHIETEKGAVKMFLDEGEMPTKISITGYMEDSLEERLKEGYDLVQAKCLCAEKNAMYTFNFETFTIMSMSIPKDLTDTKKNHPGEVFLNSFNFVRDLYDSLDVTFEGYMHMDGADTSGEEDDFDS